MASRLRFLMIRTLTIMIVLTLGTTLEGQNLFRRGDVDGDGSLGVGDVVELIIQNFYAPPGTAACEDAADVNDDGGIGISDILALIDSVFSPGGSPIPAPGPTDCGPDPTPDSLTCVTYECGTPPPPPVDSAIVLRFEEDAAIGLGTQGTVRVLIDNDSGPIDGWNIQVCHDPGRLNLVNVYGSTLLSPPPAQEFIELASDHWVATAIIDDTGVFSLPTGTGQELYVADYSGLQLGAATLDYCDTPGAPTSCVRRYAADEQGTVIPTQQSLDVEVQPVFRRGDVTGDGRISILDPLFVAARQFLGGCFGLSCEDAADVDDDGELSTNDLVALVNYLVQVPAPPLPDPGVQCGPDPTADSLGCDAYDCAPMPPPVDPAIILSHTEVCGEIGVTAEAQVILHTGGQPVVGWSFSVCPSGQGLGLDGSGVQPGADLLAVTGGVDPDVFIVIERADGSWSTAAILDQFLGPTSLPADQSFELYTVDYQVVAPGLESIDFCDAGLFPIEVATRVGACELGTATPQTVGASVNAGPLFIRGDTNGDGSVDILDFTYAIDYFYPGLGTQGPPPQSCLPGCATLDSADLNDNEYLTIADLLLLNELLFCGSAVPPPNSCDIDPTDSTNGFDQPDPLYSVNAPVVDFTGSPETGLQVEIELELVSPTPVRALAIAFEFSQALEPLAAPDCFQPDAGLTFGAGDLLETRVEENQFYVGIARRCGTLLGGSSDAQPVGKILFQLEPFAVFPPMQWISEGVVSGALYRATIVDDLYQDHAPTLTAGFEFARGNSNNLDAAVDIADAIFTLGYLFPNPPPGNVLSCMDAADANNDGKIDIADPIYTLQYLFADGDPIPPPYPQCGYDTDIDALDCANAVCP